MKIVCSRLSKVKDGQTDWLLELLREPKTVLCNKFLNFVQFYIARARIIYI